MLVLLIFQPWPEVVLPARALRHAVDELLVIEKETRIESDLSKWIGLLP
jgi:hypothetical protein